MYKNVDDKRIIMIIYGILQYMCCSADIVRGDFFFFLGIL